MTHFTLKMVSKHYKFIVFGLVISFVPTSKLSVKKLDSKAVSVVSNYLYCFGEIQLAKFGLLIDRSSSIYVVTNMSE
jgi:hypothetical protein